MSSLFRLALAAALVGPLAFAEAPTAGTAAKANNAFGFNLYKRVTKRNEKGNKFLSPLSAYLALSMASNGAAGETLAGIETALATSGISRDDINAANSELMKSLGSRSKELELVVANSMWAKKGFEMKPEFVQRVSKAYEAKLSVLDFALPAASGEINAWVKEKTKDRIPSIVPDRLPDSLRLLLINATYFKANWSSPFPAFATRLQPFYVPQQRGYRQVEVPMMSQTAYFKHGLFFGVEGIVLPYGDNGTMSMVVLLPRGGATVDQIEQDLTAEDWDKVVAELDKQPAKYGTITMPKLELSYEETLNSALIDLGMDRAFSDSAQFENLTTSEKVSISQVLQKTFVAVNEKGTEAAAATSVSISVTSLPPPPSFRMVVDRPYLFAIRDHQTGAVLFLGSIAQPEGGKLPERKQEQPIR